VYFPGLIKDFFGLFFPNNCIACQQQLVKNEETVCTHCLFALPRTNFHLNPDNTVAKIFWGRVRVEAATAYFFFGKAGNLRKLIHQLKYRGRKEVGLFLGRHFASEVQGSGFFSDAEVVIPVPLHPSRERKRGYNQSYYIARGISDVLGIPIDTRSLYRTHTSDSQTHKSRLERWQSVEKAFALRGTQDLEDKHILLVDDVITTGATLEACTQVLLSVPGTKVSIAALAYTS
jgi:ComF family protein